MGSRGAKAFFLSLFPPWKQCKANNAARQKYLAFEGLPPYPSPEQQKIIRKTWKHIELDAAKLGIAVFVGMFERYPDTQRSFSAFADLNRSALSSNVMLHAHSLHIMHMIGKVVNMLDEPENLLPLLVELGSRHVNRNANSELLSYFCPAYVEAMATRANWKKKAIDAWDQFFTFIRAAMIHGLDKGRHAATAAHNFTPQLSSPAAAAAAGTSGATGNSDA